MLWVETRRIVATMQDGHTGWDRSVRQCPRGTMNAELRSGSMTDFAVASRPAAAGPFPASAGGDGFLIPDTFEREH
jgi:hypothetical protein